MRVEELDTPAVTIDLEVLEANIRRIAAYLEHRGVALRPHIKTHKIPAIGRMQMAAGAVGITCQKIGEVEVFVEAGVSDDVLLAYNVVGREKAERLMAMAKRVRQLTVVLDNEVVARTLSAAAVDHRVEVGFLVECDTGLGRNGVQTPEAAFDLARVGMRLSGLRFRGLMTFPNRDPETGLFFERTLALLARSGIPVEVVSGGGTPAIFSVERFPMLTEHRAGTYVYNDVMVVASGTATWSDCAMQVRTTVVSRPTEGRAVLDAGSKVLTSDLYGMRGYGHVVEYPEAIIVALSEEHAVADLSACPTRPDIGETVSVVPNHCCVVSNMVDEVYGVRKGTLETSWTVAARGKVR